MIVTDVNELRKPCEKATLEEANEIVEKLKQQLLMSEGLGLAANQIGIRKNVCYLNINTENQKPYALCNPKIIEQYDEFIFENEGCLSISNGQFRKNTKRFKYCHVIDDFHPNGFIVCDTEAVIVQHEIGHLNGKLFTDYIIEKTKKVGMNDKCPCGSNKKYKRCCG